MVNHGYKLELTCDCRLCQTLPARKTFTGTSLKEAKEAAKGAGWRLSVHLTRAYAPGHYHANPNMRFWGQKRKARNKVRTCAYAGNDMHSQGFPM